MRIFNKPLLLLHSIIRRQLLPQCHLLGCRCQLLWKGALTMSRPRSLIKRPLLVIHSLCTDRPVFKKRPPAGQHSRKGNSLIFKKRPPAGQHSRNGNSFISKIRGSLQKLKLSWIIPDVRILAPVVLSQQQLFKARPMFSTLGLGLEILER